MEVHPDQSLGVLRRSKKRKEKWQSIFHSLREMLRRTKKRVKGSPFFILCGESLADMVAAPPAPDLTAMPDTEHILRFSLQYLSLCAQRVASWSAVDGMEYPSSKYILQTALPPWVHPYCPCTGSNDGGHQEEAPDRRTEPEFVYRPTASLEDWQEPNERIFDGSQEGPRPWEL
jgi:hypothetical protein